MNYEQYKEFLGKTHIGDYVSIKHRYSFLGKTKEEINFGSNDFAYILELDRVQVRLSSNDPLTENRYEVIGDYIHYPNIIDYEIRNDLKPSNNLESRVTG